MSIAAETLEEMPLLLVHHRVARDAVVEIRFLGGGRQFAVEQEIAGFEEVAVLGQLFNRVAAVEENTRVPVDIGDARLASGGGREARIVGEHPSLGVQL